MTDEQHSHNPDHGERPQKPSGLSEVKLGQRLSDQHDVWRASTPNAQPAVVKCIQAPDPELHDRIERSARLLMDRQPEGVVQVFQVEAGGDTVWIVRAFDQGIPLNRVRSLVSPAASQVAAIGIGILQALRSLHRIGMAHGALHEGNVFIGADGSVQLSDPVSAGALATGRRGDLADVEQMLLRLWRPSRRRSAPELAAILEGQRLRRARSANAAISLLREVYGDETSAGLDTLASRLLMSSGLQGTGGDEVAGGEPMTAMRELDKALALDRRRRRIRYGFIAASAVAAAALVAAGTMKLTAHAAHQTSKTASLSHHVVTARGKLPVPILKSSPSTTAAPTGGTSSHTALPTLAPAEAGFISSTSLTSSSPCSPGNECTLTSTINLGPHTDTNVTWEVVAANPCTGAQQTIASANTMASSSYKYLYETQTVTVPAGPVALYALTTSPVRVASAPLLAGQAVCG